MTDEHPLPAHLDPAFEATHAAYVRAMLDELIADADVPDTRGSSAPHEGE